MLLSKISLITIYYYRGRIVIRAFKKESYFIEILYDTLKDTINKMHTEQILRAWLGIQLDLISFFIHIILIGLMGISIYNNKLEVITILSLSLTTSSNIANNVK
jgi:hypothetical protein